jgi:hypothetical protein
MAAPHPFLKPVDASWAELASDAEPRTHGTVIMADGKVRYVPPPGSLAEQVMAHVRLTKARSSGTADTRDAQAFASYGRAPEGPNELTKVRQQ